MEKSLGAKFSMIRNHWQGILLSNLQMTGLNDFSEKPVVELFSAL